MDNDLVTTRLKDMAAFSKTGIRNLYQHLSELLPQLSSFEKDKIPPITNLEYISDYLKKYRFEQASPLTQMNLLLLMMNKVEAPQWVIQQQSLQSVKCKPQDRLIQNFYQQADRLFTPISVGFGQEESFLINSALKQIAETKSAERVRFWGKILTKTSDYYIVQGFTKKSNTDPAIKDTQKLKQGANYHIYWVTQDLLSDQWYELPLVTPEQVRASRYIKQMLTGILGRQVISSPPFKGMEKHLLKAQIVRITHNCEIAPRGMYNPLQDNPDEIDFAEEFKMPQFSELTNLENWVHVNPYILKLGRASYYVDPNLTEEQKEEQLAKLGESDPKIQRLKAINEDKGLQKFGLQGCWTSRSYGDTQVFNNVGKDEGTTSVYGVVCLRNPHWPGWYTVASNKEFGSIYIGYGLKFSQPSFEPIGPADLGVEVQQADECHEPNPKDPPDELQPDSDDENKKPEED